MAFKFKITQVEKMSRAGVGVLDGTVVDGDVSMGEEVVLVHDGQRFPMRLQGVGMDHGPCAFGATRLSLAFALREPGIAVVRAGDELVAA